MGKVTWEVHRYRVVKASFRLLREAEAYCKENYGDDWDGQISGEGQCIVSRINSSNPRTRHSFTEVKHD